MHKINKRIDNKKKCVVVAKSMVTAIGAAVYNDRSANLCNWCRVNLSSDTPTAQLAEHLLRYLWENAS